MLTAALPVQGQKGVLGAGGLAEITSEYSVCDELQMGRD